MHFCDISQDEFMENKWTLVPNNTNLTLPNKNGSDTNLVCTSVDMSSSWVREALTSGQSQSYNLK